MKASELLSYPENEDSWKPVTISASVHFHNAQAKGTPVADQAAGWGGGARNVKSVAGFGGQLFYDLFVQGRGGMPPRPLPDPLLYTA